MRQGRFQPTAPVEFGSIAKETVLPALTDGKRYLIGYAEVGNSSGGDARCGWGFKLKDALWTAGQWDDSAGASFTDDTTDAQDAGADDFALTTTTDNDGFVVQADHKFNILGITVSTAASGGSPAYDYAYWNGSAWTTLNTLATPDFSSTGDTYLEFLTPHDWTPLASGDTPVDTDGLTAGDYAIRVRATTAPSSTAALATVLWTVSLLDYVEVVGDGQSSITSREVLPLVVPNGCAVVGYCSTADNNNHIFLSYTKVTG